MKHRAKHHEHEQIVCSHLQPGAKQSFAGVGHDIGEPLDIHAGVGKDAGQTVAKQHIRGAKDTQKRQHEGLATRALQRHKGHDQPNNNIRCREVTGPPQIQQAFIVENDICHAAHCGSGGDHVPNKLEVSAKRLRAARPPKKCDTQHCGCEDGQMHNSCFVRPVDGGIGHIREQGQAKNTNNNALNAGLGKGCQYSALFR